MFWKERKIDHQLPKDRHTLTKSKTNTITLKQIRDKDTRKKGTKKEKKARSGKIESTEVIDGEWQAQL